MCAPCACLLAVCCVLFPTLAPLRHCRLRGVYCGTCDYIPTAAEALSHDGGATFTDTCPHCHGVYATDAAWSAQGAEVGGGAAGAGARAGPALVLRGKKRAKPLASGQPSKRTAL